MRCVDSEALDETQGTSLIVGTTCYSRWKHATLRLYLCLEFSFGLRGGPLHLREAIRRAIAISAPGFLVQPLTRLLADDRSRSLPSASTIQRAQIALDYALALNSRQTYLVDAVRFAWTDSSEQAGYDWWIMCSHWKLIKISSGFLSAVCPSIG